MVVVLLALECLPALGLAAAVGIPVVPVRAEIAEWRKEQAMQACCCSVSVNEFSICVDLRRSAAYIDTQVPRFKNCPSPDFPLNSRLSITTLPRESTVSTTPLIFFPS